MAKSRTKGRHAGKAETQTDIAERALSMKKSAPKAERPKNRTSDKGMRPLPNAGIAPEGALDAEGARPALSRSRGR